MKKFFIIFPVLLILLLSVLVVGPNFVDWDKYKPQIVTIISDTTGYDVSVEGALDLALVPFPRLLVEDLRVRAPVQNDLLLSLDRAEISLGLGALLQGKISVTSIVLLRPDIILQIGADGKPLWRPSILSSERMDDSDENVAAEGLNSGPSDSFAQNIMLNEVRIKEGRVRFEDLKKGALYEAEDINVILKGDSLTGPFEIDGDITYQGEKIAAQGKIGKIDGDAGSVSIQAHVELPAHKVKIKYAGVVGTGGALDLQGEISIAAQEIAQFLPQGQPALVQGAGALSGFLTVQGRERLNIKNMNFTLAKIKATGSLDVTGLAQKTPHIILTLNTEDRLDLGDFIPDEMAAHEGTGQKSDIKTKAGTTKTKAVFFPETVTLPLNFTAKSTLKIAELLYKDVVFKNAIVTLDKTEDAVNALVSAGLPDQGTLRVESKLSFGASSVSQQNGSVTLSDPEAKVSVSLKAPAPFLLAKPFLSSKQARDVEAILSGPLALDVTGIIAPDTLSVSAGRVTLDGTNIGFAGRYVPGHKIKRDFIDLKLESEALDLASWQQQLSGRAGTATATNSSVTGMQKKKGKSLGAIVENIKVPFDIKFVAAFKAVTLPMVKFSTLQAKGSLIGSKLALEVLDLKTVQGDHFAASGSIGNLQALSFVDINVRAQTLDLEKLLTLLSVKNISMPSKVGTAEVISAFNGDKNKLSFTVNMKALKGSLEAKGILGGIEKTPQINDLTVRLRHPSYVELLQLFQPSFSSAVTIRKDMDVFASVKREGSHYDLSGLRAKIGPVNLSGILQADMSGAKPEIKAALQFGDVPLDRVLGHATQKKGVTRASNSAGQKSGGRTEGDNSRWSRQALDTAWMQAFNLDMKLTADAISYGGWDVRGVDLAAVLQEGVLTLDHLTGAMHEGEMALDGQLKSTGKDRKPLSLSGHVTLTDVALESFVKAFSGERLVKAKGRISLDTQVTATGISPAALIYDLHGKGASTGHDLVFEGFDLARLSRALAAPTSSFTENFGKVLNATTAGGTTRFDTLDAGFTITEGVINFDELALDGADALVTGAGNVNLPLWTIDLDTLVALKQPADAPVLKTSFKGPLDNPGKTFGQNAMNQYFNKQLEGLILNPLLKKLQKEGILKAPAQPSQVQPMTPEDAQQVAPNQPSPSQQREVTPEDAIFGIIQGVLEGL